MSVPLDAKELSEAADFLSKYVEEHDDSTDSVLVRPNFYCMGANELEGEILDLVLTYLSRRNCSSPLKSALAHETASRLLDGDLAQFEQGEDIHLPSSEQGKKYDAMLIAKAVFHQLYLICQSWAAQLPMLYKNKYSYEVSFDAIKNTRRKMEDKHFIMADMNTLHGLGPEYPSQALFAVFDGHGGVDAACYASSQFHCNLKKFEKLMTQPLEGLRFAFTKTDADFIVKAKQERLKSGSTGVVVFIQNDILYVAWVGDSQTVIGKSGVAIELMEPHKPEREDERIRIEELGGCVVWFGGWRVNGSLAVSRAIGDYEQKPFVSSDADISQYHFEGDEDYIIIACDGLWDTVDTASAIELMDNHLQEGKSRSECSKMLVNEAKSRGSMDNISVIVVFLDAHKKPRSQSNDANSLSPVEAEALRHGDEILESKVGVPETTETRSETDKTECSPEDVEVRGYSVASSENGDSISS